MVVMTSNGALPSTRAYRLDRRFVLTTIGVQMMIAGVTALLAFLVWGPIGILTVLLLLNALRLLVWPPKVARTDPEGARLGGPVSARPVHLVWTDVDEVTIDRGALTFGRGEANSVVFSVMHLGAAADAFVRDVYDRLNSANGYTRFDPTT